MSDAPPPAPPAPVVDAVPEARGPRRWPRRLAFGCAGAILLAGAATAFAIYEVDRRWDEAERQALTAQETRARREFAPAIAKLEGDAVATPADDYDIDKTIRVIHEIDLAMKEQPDLPSWLRMMAKQDYRGVSPEVLEARRELLQLQFQLYAKQTEAEQQQAMWEMTSEMVLSTLSVVSVSGEVSAINPEGSFAVDREQAARLLDDVRRRQEERQQLLRDVRNLQDQLFAAVLDYSEVYYDHVEQWDRLCVLRDRAYLALRNEDWATVRAASAQAMAMAPHDKEAHLLYAMALIEGGSGEDHDEAQRVLATYIDEHPDATAPAFLLLGVLERERGNPEAARLHLQQAAAYYPKQADKLTEMLDPYRQRTFLRKSREGSYIVELYKSTMLGTGWFSPDLQMADTAFAEGDFNAGRQKVMDHFARRRSQQQWDYILQDIAFAEQLLGGHFREMFPEDAFLDLKVESTLWGDKIDVSIDNRSARTLHNATLILCAHFTDMHPSDYEPFAAERTIPEVPAHAVTSFGTMTVETELWGRRKSLEDVVEYRAILVTDEAVMWVDTDERKLREIRAYAEAKKKDRPLPEQRTDWYARMDEELDRKAQTLWSSADARVEPRYGFNDDVVIELPAELAMFRPTFRLKYGEHTFVAETNRIEDDKIVLAFKGVGNFDAADAEPANLVLTMDSIFGAVTVDFAPDGQAKYRFGSAKSE